MEHTQKRYQNFLAAAVYIAFSAISFYCVCLRLPVGVKYAVNLAVGAWAVLAFLINPRWEDAKFCVKFYVIFTIPPIIFWMWSCCLWIKDFQSVDYIIRGSKNIFYMLTNVLYVCSALYLFRKKAVYYTFYAMFIANLAVLADVVLKFGVSTLFSQYAVLLKTFANVTGDVIRRLELHDMVYTWGLYIVYFLLHKEKRLRYNAVFLIISIFFFTTSLKRIGVLAVFAALAVGYTYIKFNERNKKKFLPVVSFLSVMSVLIILFAFSYIIAVKSELVQTLSERFGINIMGRGRVYEFYKPFYKISPTFLGRGIRFIYNYGETTGNPEALHCVYLELYIELGFFLWFFWMIYDTYIRNLIVGKNYTFDGTGFLVTAGIFTFVTYITDYTYLYFGMNVVYMILSMAWCYEKLEKNRILTGDGMPAQKQYTEVKQ